MIYLRARKIGIDVLPKGEPFISVQIEKVIWDDNAGKEIQVIGDFDRIYRKLSDIGPLPIGTIADDGVVDALEVYTLVAYTVYSWIMLKHGGHMEGERLVIG